MQLVVSIIFSLFNYMGMIDETVLLILINAIVCLYSFILYMTKKLYKISNYFNRKDILSIIILIIECVVILLLLLQSKKLSGMNPEQYMILTVLMIFVFILCVNVLLYKIKYNEQKSELEIYQTYSAVFEELITDMRARQHDFDNHINAICNLHYVCDDYETLVKEQSKYIDAVVSDNRFYRLLTSGNPVLSGFLYGRFQTIQNLGVEISYLVKISDWQYDIPVHKVVELMGNLINNASDALMEQKGDKYLHVECVSTPKYMQIVVRNTGEKLSYDILGHLFEKGYSSKGTGRGYGLYNVKKICDNYNIEIICNNHEINGKNWVEFILQIPARL